MTHLKQKVTPQVIFFVVIFFMLSEGSSVVHGQQTDTTTRRNEATEQHQLPPAQLVERLDHQSFVTRRLAAHALKRAVLEEWKRTNPRAVDLGVEGRSAWLAGSGPSVVGDKNRFWSPPNVPSPAIVSLREALEHPTMEVRLAAAEIVRELSDTVHRDELERLVNVHCEAATIRLDHWQAFSRLAGHDRLARVTFAGISRRLGSRVFERWLVDEKEIKSTQSLRKLVGQLDPYRLEPTNLHGWATLLWIDLEQGDSMPYLTPRIALAMSHCTMGPARSRQAESTVVERLIDGWVNRKRPLCSDRERLLISMRYDLQQTASALCQRVFDNHGAPAATVVTGLLTAAVLDRPAWKSEARKRLEDCRVAHVWKMIPEQQALIRTEVRDVALALLLHDHGIDPRHAGFSELKADRTMRFCDHSIGFPSEDARQHSRQKASRLLASGDVDATSLAKCLTESVRLERSATQ